MRLRRVFMVATPVAFVLCLLSQSTASAAAPVPTTDYRLLNSRASSVAGAPALTDLRGWPPGSDCEEQTPPNAFAKEKVDGRTVPVLTFPDDNGVRIATAGLVANDQYTIVALFRLTEGTFWRRVLEFGDGTQDTGVYIDPSFHLNFWNTGNSGSTVIGADQWVQVALSRTRTTQVVKAYVDGVFQFSFPDTESLGVISSANALRFFQDACAGSLRENSPGAVARIRLYNKVLTDAQVAALDRLPKKQAITLSPSSGAPGSSVTVTGSNLGPAESVSITFKDAVTGATTTLGSATTSAAGSFTKTVTIPAGANAGTATISARGGTSKLVAKKPFTVT